MGIAESIVRQYGASLDMLAQAVERCPDPQWNAEAVTRFWRVAYHALYYTSLYLQESEKKITRWKGYRENYQHLGRLGRRGLLRRGPVDGGLDVVSHR